MQTVEILYDKGTAQKPEDFFFSSYPYFGVLDGVSSLYWRDNPPVMYGNLTGGQMVPKVAQEVFSLAMPNESLRKVLFKANSKIGKIHQEKGLSLKESEKLGAATFAIIKTGSETIDLVQGGDCFALWKTPSGFGITESQVYSHDLEMKQEISRLMEKHKGNRNKMWEEISPWMAEKRKERINKKFAELNGQPGLRNCLFEFRIKRPVEYIILFSDGLVPFSLTENGLDLGVWVIKNYEKGGLKKILSETRKEEEKGKKHSHVDYAEATAVAIKNP